MHVVRIVVAHALFNLRLLLLSPLANRDDRKKFKDQGYLIKSNFLTAEKFDALKYELTSFKGKIREVIESDTIT